MFNDLVIFWRARGFRGATTSANASGRWRVLLGGVQAIQWRPLPSSPPAPHNPRLIQSGVQVIAWRSRMGAGPGPATVLLHCQADGVGSATCTLAGTGVSLTCRADGTSTATCTLTVSTVRALICRADGIGNAWCFLGVEAVKITCLTTGAVSPTPPTPKLGILYDSPFDY